LEVRQVSRSSWGRSATSRRRMDLRQRAVFMTLKRPRLRQTTHKRLQRQFPRSFAVG